MSFIYMHTNQSCVIYNELFPHYVMHIKDHVSYVLIIISDRERLLEANILKKKIYDKVQNPTVCTHVLQWLP